MSTGEIDPPPIFGNYHRIPTKRTVASYNHKSWYRVVNVLRWTAYVLCVGIWALLCRGVDPSTYTSPLTGQVFNNPGTPYNWGDLFFGCMAILFAIEGLRAVVIYLITGISPKDVIEELG